MATTFGERAALATAPALREAGGLIDDYARWSILRGAQLADAAVAPLQAVYGYGANTLRALDGRPTAPMVYGTLTRDAAEWLYGNGAGGGGGGGGRDTPLAAAVAPPATAAPAATAAPRSTAIAPQPIDPTPVAGPFADTYLPGFGGATVPPVATPAAPTAPTPEAAPYVPLPYQRVAAPIVPRTDPVYDRDDSPSGRRVAARLEQFAGGIGAVNRMLAARDQQQMYDMRRSPQWEAEYRAAMANGYGGEAAMAVADQRISSATPGMSAAYETLLGAQGRQAVTNARSNATALAGALGRPELAAPFYGGEDFAPFGYAQGFGTDAQGNPVIRFAAGGGETTPYVQMPNVMASYALPETAELLGVQGMQAREDASRAALNEGFQSQIESTRRAYEQTMRLLRLMQRDSPEAVEARAAAAARGRAAVATQPAF